MPGVVDASLFWRIFRRFAVNPRATPIDTIDTSAIMVAVKPFFIYIDISKLYSYGKVDPFGQAKRPAQIFAHRREWQNGSQLARISDIIWKNKLAIIHTEVIWMRDRILNLLVRTGILQPLLAG